MTRTSRHHPETSRPPGPRGFYRDRLVAPDGTVADRGWRKNLIVDQARVLLAALVRGDGASGLARMLVGRGEAAWDEEPPGPPPRATSGLADPDPFEVPVASGDLAYADAAGAATDEPTNRLLLTVTLDENEPTGEDPWPLREFGLFAERDGEPMMINYVRHGVIHKPADATLERTIRLVF